MEGLIAGRICHFVLDAGDAEKINKRRSDAELHMNIHRRNSNGVQVHVGNKVSEGDVYPMMIIRVWSQDSGLVNGKVFLDGNDDYWTLSVYFNEDIAKEHTWHWIPRV